MRFSPRSLSYIAFHGEAKEVRQDAKLPSLEKPGAYLLESVEDSFGAEHDTTSPGSSVAVKLSMSGIFPSVETERKRLGNDRERSW